MTKAKHGSAVLRGLLATSLALAAGTASANLLNNGDFENFTGTAFTSGAEYRTVNNGATTITGWAVDSVSVDVIKGGYSAIAGISVDLAGTPGPGGVWQNFAATQGYTYKLSWDAANNGGSNLTVQLGTNTNTYTPVFGSSFMSFTAAATQSYMVRFSTPDGGNGGPVIDNVSLILTAVPEPGPLAMMLAGIGVLGFVARRRRA